MKRILVVDDNQEILELITLLLEMEGYNVIALNNGHGLKKMIEQFSPDVVIMDVMLGDLDGRDLCADIKGNFLTSDLPVIMISASHNLHLDTMKKACRPNDFLAKPFDIDHLIQKVQCQLSA